MEIKLEPLELHIKAHDELMKCIEENLSNEQKKICSSAILEMSKGREIQDGKIHYTRGLRELCMVEENYVLPIIQKMIELRPYLNFNVETALSYAKVSNQETYKLLLNHLNQESD